MSTSSGRQGRTCRAQCSRRSGCCVRLLVPRLTGQGYSEGGTLADLALDVDPASVSLDNAVAYGEAQARALGFGRVERIEDVAQLWQRDAPAGIGEAHAQLLSLFVPGCVNEEISSGGHGFDGVG